MRFLQIILRGIGQVMFQNNVYSGLLFLAGIFYNSWLLGLAALSGTLISTVTAQLLKFQKEDIANGLYGFNGTLSGIAVLVFFDLNLLSFATLIVASVLSTIVIHFLKQLLPPFTAPFVLVTWLVLGFFLFLFKIPLLPTSSAPEQTLNIMTAAANSFGQVMLQQNVITGLFFIAAISINDRLMAAYAIYAALLAGLAGVVLAEPDSWINGGLAGYNAILCAIALTGKSRQDFFWITLAILIATVLNIALAKTALITLTAPFVLTTWLILFFKEGKYRTQK